MPLIIRIFSDFTCPFCYLATGLIEQLKREYEIDAQWLGFELHPEVPEDGVLLEDKFPEYDLPALFEELRAKGARYGYQFWDCKLLPNTRKILEAAEFARDHSKHDAFQAAAFQAYFSRGIDIGQIEAILSLAREVGLDPDSLKAALAEGRYRSCLDESRTEGLRFNVSVLPTFVFEGGQRIVGLRSIEPFRQIIKGLPHRALPDTI